ncbi:FAD-dependent oxidoreductase [Paracoccus aminophilus]|uniref:Flavin-dependent monooxygenase n=1 Tax=Paracoccus aminophilus JCM 7686 TaxID=1367847 RepID=S5XJY4_PARAH|nr:NAD(P)/FAD-dependent oxidoreductase [Paracoccus aminophilus]AGT07494.1 salicylate hydroxylase [Paracoccus aminophilus JCM 7686]
MTLSSAAPAQTAPQTPLRIAIIGAGPGGLTLARILHVQGIATTLFERETDPHARAQGGTLDLHAETGQLALRRAGLEAEFQKLARYEDQGSRLCDETGRLLLADDDAEDGDRPEIDRSALRDLLLGALPAEMIRWGQALREVVANPDGSYDVVTTAGRETFDLVVGADGTWSKVRPLVSRYQPAYSGLTFIEFGIDDVDHAHPELAALVGKGKLGIESNDARAMIIQRNGHAHLRGYVIFRVPLDWAEKRFDFSDPASVRRALEDELLGWSPKVLAFIRASNDQIVPRPIFALPVGHHWPNRPGITLIGDAAHVMSPFGGEGANAALFDAAELARHLTTTPDWRSAVAAYEAEMFERVEEPARFSAEGAATELSHRSREFGLAWMEEHLQQRKAEASA